MMTPSSFVLLLATTAGLSVVGHAWTPVVGNSWNYNLETPVDTTVDVDVVFIDTDDAQDTIDALHDNGKVVVCYISIGSMEDWRDDADDFPAEAIGNDLDGWGGEKWLDVTNTEVRKIMAARVKTAAGMNCDAIELDNMSVYSEEDTGVDVSRSEQIQYNRWFAKKVHASGMLVGLKNVVELTSSLVSYFDFAINESCHEYDECDVYTDTFLAADKPVFNVEYVNNMDMCDESNALGLDTIIKNYNLKAPFCSCADSSRNLDCDSVL